MYASYSQIVDQQMIDFQISKNTYININLEVLPLNNKNHYK